MSRCWCYSRIIVFVLWAGFVTLMASVGFTEPLYIGAYVILTLCLLCSPLYTDMWVDLAFEMTNSHTTRVTAPRHLIIHETLSDKKLSPPLVRIICAYDIPHNFDDSTILSCEQLEQLTQFHPDHSVKHWRCVNRWTRTFGESPFFITPTSRWLNSVNWFGECDKDNPRMLVVKRIDGEVFGGFSAIGFAPQTKAASRKMRHKYPEPDPQAYLWRGEGRQLNLYNKQVPSDSGVVYRPLVGEAVAERMHDGVILWGSALEIWRNNDFEFQARGHWEFAARPGARFLDARSKDFMLRAQWWEPDTGAFDSRKEIVTELEVFEPLYDVEKTAEV